VGAVITGAFETLGAVAAEGADVEVATLTGIEVGATVGPVLGRVESVVLAWVETICCAA
jgi:hypothetical protein